jgi:hypothetical protein
VQAGEGAVMGCLPEGVSYFRLRRVSVFLFHGFLVFLVLSAGRLKGLNLLSVVLGQAFAYLLAPREIEKDLADEKSGDED